MAVNVSPVMHRQPICEAVCGTCQAKLSTLHKSVTVEHPVSEISDRGRDRQTDTQNTPIVTIDKGDFFGTVPVLAFPTIQFTDPCKTISKLVLSWHLPIIHKVIYLYFQSGILCSLYYILAYKCTS